MFKHMLVPVRRAAIAALIAVSTAAPAAAQPAPLLAVPGGTQLVNVNLCAPRRDRSAAYTGFSPGFYPLSPYGWMDPYGFRYNQIPLTSATGTLFIDYINTTKRVMTTIDFGLVARGKLVAEVRDVGTFSPNVEIKHQFGLDTNVFPLRTALSRCVPLHIIFADGTSWKNPHLPPARKDMYRRRH